MVGAGFESSQAPSARLPLPRKKRGRGSRYRLRKGSFQRQSYLRRTFCHQHAVLVLHLEVDGNDTISSARVFLLLGDAAGYERGIADEGGTDIARVAMNHETQFTAPVAEVIQNPRAHRRAVAVAARHPNQLGVFFMDVAARGTVVETVAVSGIDPRLFH